MTIIRAFAAFTGWLTGALAGLGVIFYAIGYLVTRAHLTFLGIYGLFDEGYIQMVTEGAMFALSIASFIGAVLLPLSVVFGVGALFVVLVVYVFKYLGWSDAIQNRLRPISHFTRTPVFDAVLYVALLFALLYHYDLYFNAFQSPLLITNVLYANGDATAGSSSPPTPAAFKGAAPAVSGDSSAREIDRIRQWLQHGDVEHAHDYFRKLLWGEVFAGLLLAAAWHITNRWKWRVLWLSYFAISFVVYSISLPMLYGVLVAPIEYPVITLDLTDASTDHPAGKMFLLSKTDQEFILWDSEAKRILWIPRNEVKQAAIREIENLFGSPNIPGSRE